MLRPRCGKGVSPECAHKLPPPSPARPQSTRTAIWIVTRTGAGGRRYATHRATRTSACMHSRMVIYSPKVNSREQEGREQRRSTRAKRDTHGWCPSRGPPGALSGPFRGPQGPSRDPHGRARAHGMTRPLTRYRPGYIPSQNPRQGGSGRAGTRWERREPPTRHSLACATFIGSLPCSSA